MTISAANSSDAHRVGRPRRRPPRTTRLFHGTSSRITSPAMPWAMAAHRPLADPIATVATPVPKTSSRATRSVWLVILPAGGRTILRSRPGARGAPGIIGLPPGTSVRAFVIRYVPLRAVLTGPRCRIVSPVVHAERMEPIFEAVLANDPSRIAAIEAATPAAAARCIDEDLLVPELPHML